MASQINDGMTLEADLAALGAWDAMTYRFRPALPEQVAEYLRGQQSGTKKPFDATILFLFGNPTNHGIVSWDLKDAKGEMVPVGPHTLRRLPYARIQALVDSVCGYNAEARETDSKN